MEFTKKQKEFLKHIDTMKSKIEIGFFSAVNVTLIANPYISEYPKRFISKNFDRSSIFLSFIKSSTLFYIKNLGLYYNYMVSFFLYKRFYKKRVTPNSSILIDKFFLVDNIIKEKKFEPKYFKGLYRVLDDKNIDYKFLVRLYGANRKPSKLKEFFKILNEDRRAFLFEFELLKFKDFMEILGLILAYPFATLSMLQKGERDFNIELIKDIKNQQFEAFSRYILGKNISNFDVDKIISWSEFQVTERAFNYGLDERADVYACQFYLSYNSYFNTFVSDIDVFGNYAPKKVLVNGKYFLLDRKEIEYSLGVSLRYRELFSTPIYKNGENILLLGAYVESDTRYMIELLDGFTNVIFKNHPAVDIEKLGSIKFKISDESIYRLFRDSKIVVTTASGTAVEAIACGISVIVVESRDNLTSNPLSSYGKGLMWDSVNSRDELIETYNRLLKKREEVNIDLVAKWYRDNFFIEPTKENIVKAFEL